MQPEDWRKQFEGIPDEELIQELLALHDAIWKVDCYNWHDLLRHELIAAELEERGYTINETRELEIIKPEGGE